MGLNRNSNSYTIIFAVILVVVVGSALAFTAISLKDLQVKNQLDAKMVSILSSVGVDANRQNANELFYEYIKERMVINADGEVITTETGKIDPKNPADPFNVNVQAEYRDKELAEEDRNYPLYKAEIDGETVLIIPVVGKGLWGPIWGYISLKDDYNTVYGAVFNHKGETPGLGAEIAQAPFQNPFEGKTIYEDGDLVSITVRKGGALPGNPHQVDAITGGTITSNGVTEMLMRTLTIYDRYFEHAKTASNS